MTEEKDTPMTKRLVQTWVGLIIVLSHFGILTLVLVSPAIFQLEMRDAISLTEIIAPLFAGYTTAIVKYYFGQANPISTIAEPASLPYVVIALFIPSILSLLVLFFFLGYALSFLHIDLDGTRTAIAGLEALFGVYVGFILEGLFRYRASDSHAEAPTSADAAIGKHPVFEY
jgi:hypothetical protein